jgi:hypothetical protein
MGDRLLQISDDFWNIRGSFKIAGVIDIGTQASLVRLKSGKFVFLDSYTLNRDLLDAVNELTSSGKDITAVLNLHPFHTLHVEWMHKQFPKARHYGTARHVSRFPALAWQKGLMEEKKTQAAFAADFEFSVPRGVDFISDDENLHFSSVLAYHPASKTIHVDDTFMYIRMPLLMRFFGLHEAFSFHLTSAKVLQKRPGAAQEFRDWANLLAEDWQDAENFCAAHNATLLREDNDTPIAERILKALTKVEPTLKAHEQKYG